MLWRGSYVTPIYRNVALPIEFGPDIRILIVLLSPQALAEADLWQRLISADLPDEKYLLVLDGAESPESLSSLLPPSRHSLVLVTPTIDWASLVPTDQADRVMVLAISGVIAKVLMVGPPTEDAWDEFRAAT